MQALSLFVNQVNRVRELPNNGGFILIGEGHHPTATNYDFYLIQLDNTGQLLWAKAYQMSGSIGATDIILTKDPNTDQHNGYAFIGFSLSNPEFHVITTDLNGVKQWERSFGTIDLDFPYSLVQLPDYGYAIVGSNNPLSSSNQNILVMKLDNNGTLLWSRVLETINNEEAWGMTVTNGGNIALAGVVSIPASTNSKTLLIEIDNSGNLLSSYEYNFFTGVNVNWRVVQGIDSYFTFTGYSDDDATLMRVKPDGSLNNCIPGLFNINILNPTVTNSFNATTEINITAFVNTVDVTPAMVVTSINPQRTYPCSVLAEQNFNLEISQQGQRVRLLWNGLADEGEYYRVERSLDGKNFNIIAEVNSQGLLTYGYSDEENLRVKNLYYKITTIDGSGVFLATDVKAIRHEREIGTLNVYPHPILISSPVFTVSLPQETQGYVTLTISNLYGQIIFFQEENLHQESSFQVTLPSYKLSPGFYLMKVNTEKKSMVKQILMH